MKFLLLLLACVVSTCGYAQGAPDAQRQNPVQRVEPDAEAMLSAVVRVSSKAIEGARSSSARIFAVTGRSVARAIRCSR